MDSRTVISGFIDKGEMDKAIEFVDELPLSDAETWYLKGKIFSRMGKLHEALSCYNNALTIDPGHEEAQVMIDLSQRIYAFKDPNRYNH